MDHDRTRRTLAKASQPLSEKDSALVGILKSRFRDATAQWQAAETPTRTASTGAPQTASRQWTPHTMTASHRAPKGKGIWLFRTMPTWDVLARTRSRARFEQCTEYDWLFPLPPFLSDSWAFLRVAGWVAVPIATLPHPLMGNGRRPAVQSDKWLWAMWQTATRGLQPGLRV
ncbi:hypothetical protein CNYM01_02298 [Colletotrichum nymphaeae SA-01]|uniref:Uncharacterized protein n=1 Tax=Colletotrichum nymphaeae SA-01 TaxID=1460502 RepID=A0A135UU27_9PEZI|nr:hypothetical protein CNYM01_02298 [Colletotrichum nymphaeae SA-01]